MNNLNKNIIIEQLIELNFSKLEAEIYINLLESKTGTAYGAASTLKTKSAAYAVLHKLLEKNLVTKIKNKNRTIYTAKPIEKMLLEKQERENIIYKNIFKLSKYLSAGSDSTNIKIWNTKDQIKEAVLYNLSQVEEKTIYCVYPSGSKTSIEPKESVYFNLNKNIFELGCKKIIISDTKVKKEYDTLDTEFNFKRYKIENDFIKEISKMGIGFEIHKNFMIKIYFYREGLVLGIENKSLSNFAYKIFESLLFC